MSYLEIAAELAERAHAGQVDKSGAAYIDHPRRVAARVTSDAARAVALLHDVIEDTDTTDVELLNAGIPSEVVDAVLALTRRRGQAPTDYYAAVAANTLALEVKRADIADNTDPARAALLDDATRVRLAAKYAKATKLLDEMSAGRFRS